MLQVVTLTQIHVICPIFLGSTKSLAMVDPSIDPLETCARNEVEFFTNMAFEV